MKQVLQKLSDGETWLADVPCPKNMNGSLLIASCRTLISAGTERMLVDFGKASFITKARKQPEKVNQVLNKIKTDGLFPTIDAVRTKLDQPIPLGYSNAGVVLESGVEGFEKGDRVVSNGCHAEVVRVPKHLCAKIPDQVDNDSAAFVVLGAVGLQGIRLLKPTLGEGIVVFGLGLIGLMCVQMLRANGCRVLGIEMDSSRCALARQLGAETVDLSRGQDLVSAAQTFSRGRGVDGVVVTAASQSDEIIHQAAEICRKRGRIILVGVAGLNLRRDDFFKKELSFQVSASYGPGRYDPLYEEKGQDYPVGFVRWTEQRNFEAVLDMMETGTLDVKLLISHRFSIDEAQKAYEVITGSDHSLAILLEYPGGEARKLNQQTMRLSVGHSLSVHSTNRRVKNNVSVSFVGAGNYATAMLIPAFRAVGARLRSIASAGGISSTHVGEKFGFEKTTTDSDMIFSEEETDVVVISTRHNSHADLVLKAQAAGKHVFVEKPLCLSLSELKEITEKNSTFENKRVRPMPILMIGFNRRFAPLIQKLKSLLQEVSSQKSFVMTVNAGMIPVDHWTQDSTVGGGRIIGEACHFIDLLRYLAGYPIRDAQMLRMKTKTNDTVSLGLCFSDGSIGTVHYFANGNRSFPKERLEVFAGGRILQLDNFRKITGFGWPGFRKMRLFKQDKGQKACVEAFVRAVMQGDESPIPVEELFEVTRVTLELEKQGQEQGVPVAINLQSDY